MKKVLLFIAIGFFTFSVYANPKLLWEFDSEAPIYGDCLLQGETLFCGNTAGKVLALNADSGKPLWSFSSDGAIYSAISKANDHVYFQSDGGYVYKLNRHNGRLVWRINVVKSELPIRSAGFEPGGWDDKSSTPVFDHGSIYVGTAEGSFVAIDDASGTELWRFTADGSIRTTPALSDEFVVFGTFSGTVYNLHKDSGKLAWAFDVESVVDEPSRRIAINSNPAIDGDTVFIGSRNMHLFALDLNSGEAKWTYRYHRSWVESSAVIDNGVLFIGSSFLRAQLSINAESGQLIWQNQSIKGLSFSTPTIANDGYYTGIAGGYNIRQKEDFAPYGGAVKLDKVSGNELWRFEIENFYPDLKERGVVGGIIVSGSKVWFGAMNGMIYGLTEIAD